MSTSKPSKTASAAASAAVTNPSDGAGSFPIVGIGASAGGLAAFEAFFAGMPQGADPGMAFVLVQHLAPDHKSILADLVRRYTRMQVFEVEDGMQVHINCAYIIPPNRDMAFLNGHLQLLEPSAPRGQRLPIDYFFRSLAQDQHERAIGIILSGTGSDGTAGVRAIKGDAGMVIVQSPDSTEFDGMPRSALATGLVDFELPPNEMANQLITYVARAFGTLPRLGGIVAPQTENSLKRIFILLRAQTGHDFSQYKPSTIHRRIERRMAVHQIETLESYVKFLQLSPGEVEALFRDLLIGVTNFFRDTDAFTMLEQQILPKLFADKPAGGVLRVWVPGCSTGEEAYSIAILMQERIEALKQSYTVQVFATDIDSRAIATARAGLYPNSIAADITPSRLARFFAAEPDASAYRIHKVIRDMLVFSEQDIIKDPPFSRLDLLSCRNLLIYLGPELQKKLIPLFHYALKPGGILFLGTSEGVGDFGDLFAVLDRKTKIYQRKQDFQGMQRAAVDRLAFLPPMSGPASHLRASGKAASSAKLPLRELTEQALLQQIAPTGALVNEHGDVLYLHGRFGMYMELVPGEASVNNVLKMAREGLRAALVTALHKAVITHSTVRVAGLRVRTNEATHQINLSVRPVLGTTAHQVSDAGPAQLFLVILEEVSAPEADTTPVSATTPAKGEDATTQAQIAALREELRAKDEYIQSTHEQLESSTEELKSSNEEMQSVNEELQSTNEELETSKEELQSVNEELATVNNELQTKVIDLSRLNNDMNNLLAGTGIATVFVDHQLRILRFTPTASEILNLILADVGRPVGHIVSNLRGYDSLAADVKTVLDTLAPKDVQVQTTQDKWFNLRIRPYRTLDNVIEGAVISFVDATDSVQQHEALRKANDLLHLAVVVRDAHDAITVQDLTGRTLAWNPGAERLYGWSEAQALALNVRERIPESLRAGALETLARLSRTEILQPYLTQRLTASGAVLEVSIISTALLDDKGQMYAIATTERAMDAGHGPQ